MNWPFPVFVYDENDKRVSDEQRRYQKRRDHYIWKERYILHIVQVR